jgi:DNA-binding transcriptional MerR regulator
MDLMRVNEAARELEVSESWLRRAEGKGRIPKARRDLNGWRVYSPLEIEFLKSLLHPTAQS